MEKRQKIVLLFCILGLILLFACEKKENFGTALDFKDFREMSTSESKLKLIDDLDNETTSLIIGKRLIFLYTWQHGIYSGPIMPVRVLWARDYGYEFALIGRNDLLYNQLVVVYPDKSFKIFEVAIIKLLGAELCSRGDSTLIRLVYNNSWIRTGPIEDGEKMILL